MIVTNSAEAAAVGWTLRRWARVTAALAGVLAVIFIVGGAVGITRLTEARERLADDLDPAVRTAQQLSAARFPSQAHGR